MQEIKVQLSPAASGAAPVEKQVEVPGPKPFVQQLVAGVVLVALTAGLIVLLMNDPGTAATFLISVGLLMCVFALVIWASAVAQLGIGPSQLFKLLKMVFDALKEAKEKEKKAEPPTPAQPAVPGGGPAPR